jgi:acetylornithine deacetylase
VTREAVRDARRLLRPLRYEIVRMLQALVRANTAAVPPHGRETAGQKVLRRFLRPHRLDVEMYDAGFLARSRHPYVRRDRRYAGRHNLIARLPGAGRGRSLLLSGHMDTVPTRPGPWRDGPFSGAVRRGRLHGRGSWDMKGGLAAQFAVAMALKKAGVRLAGDLLCESAASATPPSPPRSGPATRSSSSGTSGSRPSSSAPGEPEATTPTSTSRWPRSCGREVYLTAALDWCG